MGLFDFFKSSETRAETVQTTEDLPEISSEGKGAELLTAMLGGNRRVTASMAMQIPEVARCVHMVAQAAASLPVKMYRKSEKGVEEISDDPRLDMLCGETGDTIPGSYMRYLWVRDLLLTGAAYGFIEREGGVPTRVFYVAPENVGVLVNNDDVIHKSYRFSVRGKVCYPFEFLKIFRCPDGYGRGRGIVSENSLVLDTAYSLFEFQRSQMEKGGAKKGFLKSATHVSDKVIDVVREKWRRLYSNRDSDTVIFLNDGIDFREISNTPMEMQLNQNMRTIGSEIMRIFGSEDGMLTAETVKNAVMPVLDMMETAFDSDLLLESEKGNVYFAFDTRELTRGDISARFGAYASALDKGFMQIDEVRELEDLPALGIDFIKLNLADSFYDPKTKRIYTPNTNQWTEFGGGGNAAEDEESPEAAAPETEAESEVRFNENHDPENGRFTSGDGENISGKELDKSGGSGIIESGSDYVTISSIEQPIEQKHTSKGNPNAILHYDVPLNNRQEKLLEQLSEFNSRVTVPKNSVNMSDLSALTAKTGDEFAMFTKENTRLIVRGNSIKVDINSEQATELSNNGYKWSGHTHPGTTTYCLFPSDGDKEILKCFSQDTSVIYNSKGDFSTFGKE